MAEELDIIIIDDSDDESVVKPSSTKAKRHHRDSSPVEEVQPFGGRQSQAISIDDLDSEVGHDAIDVLFGDAQAAGIEVAAAEGLVTVTSTTLINADQADQALPLLINVLPDLDPEYGLLLLQEKVLADGKSHTIEHCLQTALEVLFADATYPKAKKSSKRKRLDESDDEDDERSSGPSSTTPSNAGPVFQPGKSAYKSKAFLAEKRKGAAYRDKALVDLDNLFPLMLTTHIRCIFSANLKQFVPTYFALKAETLLPDDEKPYVPMKQERPQKPLHVHKGTASKKGKGKAKGKQSASGDGATEYDAEREWFIAYLMNKGDGTSYDHARILVPATEDGDTECSCCFGDDDLSFMVQCAEGHNFCRDCIRKMTEVAVGDQTANVVCPHTDGCEAKFYDRDLRKAMPVKLYNTYAGIIQRKELEEAGIEGLESCPYCNFALIIENPDERLFACQSDDCGAVSCRKCRKHEHLPKTCEEAAKDNVLNHRHAVEEAMSAALIRKCPKCDQACVKGDGCNKMRCHTCHTLFCNVCRATITGYEHFDQTPANYAQPKDPKKCRLWDPKDQDLYRDEVAAARENARREIIRNENGDIQEDDVEVALPEVNLVPHRGAHLPFEMFGGGMGQRLDAAFANGRANAPVGVPHGPAPFPDVGGLMRRAGHDPPNVAFGALMNPEEVHRGNAQLREALGRLRALQAQAPPGLPAPAAAAAAAGVQDPAAPLGGLDARAVARALQKDRLVAELARLRRARHQGEANNAAALGRNEAAVRMAERLRDPRIPLPVVPSGRDEHPAPTGSAGERVVCAKRRQSVPSPPLAGDIMEAPLDAAARNDNDNARVGVQANAPLLRIAHLPRRQPNAGGNVRFVAPAQVPARQDDEERPRRAAGIARIEGLVENLNRPHNAQGPRAAGRVRFEEAAENRLPAPIGLPAELPRPVPGRAAVAREEVREMLRNRIAARNDGNLRAAIGDAEVPALFAGPDHEAMAIVQRIVADYRARGGQGAGIQENINTLAGAERQLRRVLLDIRRDFQEIPWADLVDVARDRGGPMLQQVEEGELAPARRISPRHSAGLAVDPLSVLLVLHQRHSGWVERYYDSLVNSRITRDSHDAFNRHAASIVEGLRDGTIQPPVVQPAGRPSADTLRQLHACWHMGAHNLVTLLERVMQNAGVNFPANRRLPEAAASFANLMINNCPERILLAHCQCLLRGRLAVLPVILLQRRQAVNIAAGGPNQGRVVNDDGRANPRLVVPVPGAEAHVEVNRVPDDLIPDDPPPPYEAVGAGQHFRMPPGVARGMQLPKLLRQIGRN